MSIFQLLVLILLSLNLALGSFIAYRMLSVKSALRELQVMYFAETLRKESLIKKEVIVKIKGQLLLGGIPVGQAFVLTEHVSEVLDKDKVNLLLNEFAKPLIDLGVKTTIKSYL